MVNQQEREGDNNVHVTVEVHALWECVPHLRGLSVRRDWCDPIGASYFDDLRENKDRIPRTSVNGRKRGSRYQASLTMSAV